jgi:hypothetical protein
MRKIACVAFVLIISLFMFVPSVSTQESVYGPEIDVLRYKVFSHPDDMLVAMQTCQADISADLIRSGDIETLAKEGFTVTSTRGLHLSFIGFNCREDQSYRRPEITFWPLADVNFRHALAHSFDRVGICTDSFDYLVNPVDSLVPPSQGGFYNPGEAHPFSLGDPFAETVYPNDHSTCGILRYGGYTFMDADSSGTVTTIDYWLMPNGEPLPEIRILAISPEVACYIPNPIIVPWTREDAAQIGLAADYENGWSGLREYQIPFFDLMEMVYEDLDFDAFILFHSLDRLPMHLYTLFHPPPCAPWDNPFGVDDPVLLDLVETIRYSLDYSEIREACHAAQERLANAEQPWGLPTIPVYSWTYFDSFNPGLLGVVNSPGYGADNQWTYLDMRWQPDHPNERVEDGNSVVIECLPDEPASFNPFYNVNKNVEAWKFMGRVFDPLVAMNPYNHNDIPWIATDWTIEETPTGMEINFTLRDDVYWQDGYPYTAYDVEFCLEFLRDYAVPTYAETWENLIDVVVTDDTHFTIQADAPSLGLLYDFSVVAAVLPPQVWDRPWSGLEEILIYDLSGPYDPAPGHAPGSTPPSTNLFGTGAFIFEFYDSVDLTGDLMANRNYFITVDEIDNLKVEMFWEVGDYNRDALINVIDLAFVSFAYGSIQGIDPGYDPNADFNQDSIIDMRDVFTIGYHLNWQKEYP